MDESRGKGGGVRCAGCRRRVKGGGFRAGPAVVFHSRRCFERWDDAREADELGALGVLGMADALGWDADAWAAAEADAARVAP